MRFLRSNTAVMVTVGPFIGTDGVTLKTALTITAERITLTADTDAGSAPTNILDNVTGATSATANDLNYITGNDAALMQLELAAADTNRVGRMFLSITDAVNHLPVFHEFFVLPQAIYDWLTGVIVPLPANVTQLLGTAWLAPGTAGTPDVNAKLAGGTAWGSGAITAASIAADAITAAKVADGTIDAATFAAGAINAAAIATDAITSAKIAADAIGASELAADAVTEIQSGLATAAALTTVDDFLDTEVAAILAAVDTEVGAIKTKTDQLTFTVANKIDANALNVDGDANAAGNLRRATLTNALVTIGTASTTTSIVTSSMSPAAAVTDQFKGRSITFDRDTTTTNLKGQSTVVTASTAVGVLTVSPALTTAPVSGDTAVLM